MPSNVGVAGPQMAEGDPNDFLGISALIPPDQRSTSPWFNSGGLQELLARTQAGQDGRKVLNRGQMLSLLTPQSGLKMLGEPRNHSAQQRRWADDELSPAYQASVDDPGRAARTADEMTTSYADYRGANNQLYHGVAPPDGQDPNGQYVQWSDNSGDGFENPTGSNNDRMAPIYKLDAKGNATPVATGDRYTPSAWVDYGRDLSKLAAVMAAVGFGGPAIAEALGGAGGAGGMATAGGYGGGGATAAGELGGLSTAGGYGGLEAAAGELGATGGAGTAGGYGGLEAAAGAGGGAGQVGSAGWLQSINSALGTKLTAAQVAQMGLKGVGLLTSMVGGASGGRGGAGGAGGTSASAAGALASQVQQADALVSFNQEQLANNRSRQVTADGVSNAVTNNALALSRAAAERSANASNLYNESGAPVIKQSLDEARNFDSQGNIAAARGRATADVEQGFANAEESSQTALTRMGINPSSGRFMALQQRMGADKAAALAGGATNAETGVRDRAIAMRQQASNLAGAVSDRANSGATLSANAGTAAAASSNQSLNQNINVGDQMIRGTTGAANIYGNAAGGNQAAINANNAQSNARDQQSSSNLAGWGQLAGSIASSFFGGKANGGEVSGPGTGTSDSVPAVNTTSGSPMRLSDGEYVISADTVRAKGTDFFDKLQAKHHKHVNVGATA